MTLTLRVATGREAGQRLTLAESATLLIGRGEDCGLRLSDPSASRVHCRIIAAGGRVFIEDAASRWGTLVNNAAIESQELRPGDRIVIGDTELQLEVDAPESATLPPERARSPQPVTPAVSGAAGDCVPESLRAPPARRPVNLTALVGERFLRYRVGSIVARTRTGVVFRAFDPGRRASDGGTDERVIALKVFAPEFFQSEQAMRRFIRAIRTMLPLQHENLVRLHTAGRWHGLCFASSEFVEGHSATQVIQRVGIAGMLDWRRAWQIAAAVARALDCAHQRGIVHRNITPGHILIDDGLQVIKLGDLMLARAMDDCGEQITRPGEVVGNLRYLAPEQLSGDGWIDGRADIYSLGATLYAVLTGHPPYDGATAGDVVRAVLTGGADPPGRAHIGIPPAFEGVVLRMLARDPDDRYASAGDLLRELERVRKYTGFST